MEEAGTQGVEQGSLIFEQWAEQIDIWSHWEESEKEEKVGKDYQVKVNDVFGL